MHNVLNVQMAMDYVQYTHQELIVVQLDMEKSYDYVNWFFVSRLMHPMGFGPYMFLLELNPNVSV